MDRRLRVRSGFCREQEWHVENFPRTFLAAQPKHHRNPASRPEKTGSQFFCFSSMHEWAFEPEAQPAPEPSNTLRRPSLLFRPVARTARADYRRRRTRRNYIRAFGATLFDSG